jgi:hypothetical protein
VAHGNRTMTVRWKCDAVLGDLLCGHGWRSSREEGGEFAWACGEIPCAGGNRMRQDEIVYPWCQLPQKWTIGINGSAKWRRRR